MRAYPIALLWLPAICLGAAPCLLLLSGRWGTWSSAKVLGCTACLLASLGAFARFGKGGLSRQLEELPWWTPLPVLFAVWGALLCATQPSFRLELLGETGALTLATFVALSLEDWWARFTGWAYRDLDRSPTVPKWLTSSCLFATAAAVCWSAYAMDNLGLYGLAAAAVLVAIASLRAPPIRL